MEIPNCILIDNGSGTIKAGYTSESSPRHIFPCILATDDIYVRWNDYYIGDEALEDIESFVLTYPIKDGIVTNWDEMEQIWHHTFYNCLKVCPDQHPIILTVPPLNPLANRERTLKLMLDCFSVSAKNIFFESIASLALHATSYGSTGLVVDSGDGCTHVVPMIGRQVIPHAICTVEVSGNDVTEYLNKMLIEQGHSMKTKSGKIDWKAIREIKETLAYVAIDYDDEATTKNNDVAEYLNQLGRSMKTIISGKVDWKAIREIKETLAMNYNDTKIVEALSNKIDYATEKGFLDILGNESLFTCTEILFNPFLIGKDGNGIPQAICDSYHQSKFKEASNQLYFTNTQANCLNIVLCGGNTMFQGFPERLEKEVNALLPSEANINFVAKPDRKNLFWRGANIKWGGLGKKRIHAKP